MGVGIYILRYHECSRISKLFAKTNGYVYINLHISIYSGLQKGLKQSGDTKFLYFLNFPKLLFRDYCRFILIRLSAKNIRTFGEFQFYRCLLTA